MNHTHHFSVFQMNKDEKESILRKHMEKTTWQSPKVAITGQFENAYDKKFSLHSMITLLRQ